MILTVFRPLKVRKQQNFNTFPNFRQWQHFHMGKYVVFQSSVFSCTVWEIHWYYLTVEQFMLPLPSLLYSQREGTFCALCMDKINIDDSMQNNTSYQYTNKVQILASTYTVKIHD